MIPYIISKLAPSLNHFTRGWSHKSPLGAIFDLSPPETGTNLWHPRPPPPIFERLTDQLIWASFPHTHFWYGAGILKVPAYRCKGSFVLPVPSEHKWEAFIKTGSLFICTFIIWYWSLVARWGHDQRAPNGKVNIGVDVFTWGMKKKFSKWWYYHTIEHARYTSCLS